MASIDAIRSSGALIKSFLTAAEDGEAVKLKDQEVRSTPAKTGFFTRIVQWIRGESPAKVNTATREAFTAALKTVFDRKIVNDVLKDYRLTHSESLDKPLSSRDVRHILEDLTTGASAKKIDMNYLTNKVVIDTKDIDRVMFSEKIEEIKSSKTMSSEEKIKVFKEMEPEGRRVGQDVPAQHAKAVKIAEYQRSLIASLNEILYP